MPYTSKLTIITINLNNKDGLQKTILSVINQTFSDFEYIIIDGASTDGSIDTIKQYAGKITWWVSEPDKGIYNAFNKGIAKAKGEYCLFLNSGDWLVANDILDKVIPNLNADIVYGDIYIIKAEKTEEYILPDKLKFSFLFENYLPHPASFIKTSLFNKTGTYNENYKICSDWEFSLKAIALHHCTTRHIPVPVSYFPAGGISSKYYDTIVRSERKAIMEELFPLFYADYEELHAIKATHQKKWVHRAIRFSNNKYITLFNHYASWVFKR